MSRFLCIAGEPGDLIATDILADFSKGNLNPPQAVDRQFVKSRREGVDRVNAMG
jgi:hypothetical protein